MVFLLWFPSGIGIMYWDFPERQRRAIGSSGRRRSMPSTCGSRPNEAYARLADEPPPAPVRLNTFDGRPVYRFGDAKAIVYADTGEAQIEVSTD